MSTESIFYCGACKHYEELEDFPSTGKCTCLEHNEPVPLAGGRYLAGGCILYDRYQCGCNGKYFLEKIDKRR